MAVPLHHRGFAKWRAATLVLVYLLFVVHVVHWQLSETTLAPLELNELLYTLEAGIVTAGFLLMATEFLRLLLKSDSVFVSAADQEESF